MKSFSIILLLIAVSNISMSCEKVPESTFTTKKWIEASPDKEIRVHRIKMIDDLLKRYTLKGMKEVEIQTLLGSADKTEYFKEWDRVYWLGPERGFISIDSEWLVLKFDKKNIVVDAQVVKD